MLRANMMCFILLHEVCQLGQDNRLSPCVLSSIRGTPLHACA